MIWPIEPIKDPEKRSNIFSGWFQIRWYIRLLCILPILSSCTDPFRVFSVYEQIHSAYSQYTDRFIPLILSVRTAKFCLKIYVIPPILYICTDSFHIFSEYQQILNIRNGIIFHTAFKEILLLKKYKCVQLDQRPTTNNRLFALVWQKKILSACSDDMQDYLQIRISRRIQIYILK